MEELRCEQCNKLFEKFYFLRGVLEIKCPRCNHVQLVILPRQLKFLAIQIKPKPFIWCSPQQETFSSPLGKGEKGLLSCLFQTNLS